jgi:hypothetical protein
LRNGRQDNHADYVVRAKCISLWLRRRTQLLDIPFIRSEYQGSVEKAQDLGVARANTSFGDDDDVTPDGASPQIILLLLQLLFLLLLMQKLLLLLQTTVESEWIKDVTMLVLHSNC